MRRKQIKLTKKQIFDLEFKYGDMKKNVSKKHTYNSYKFWNSICTHNRRNIPEEFIKEYKDYVNWDYIIKYEDLPLSFFLEFGEDYINWDYLLYYLPDFLHRLLQNSSEEDRNKVFKKCSPDTIRKLEKYNWTIYCRR